MTWTRAVLCAALVFFCTVSGGVVVLALWFGLSVLPRGGLGLGLVLLPAGFAGLGGWLAWKAFARRSFPAFLLGLPLLALFSFLALLAAMLHDGQIYAEEAASSPVSAKVLLFLLACWLLALLGGVALLWRLPPDGGARGDTVTPAGGSGRAAPSRE